MISQYVINKALDIRHLGTKGSQSRHSDDDSSFRTVNPGIRVSILHVAATSSQISPDTRIYIWEAVERNVYAV